MICSRFTVAVRADPCPGSQQQYQQSASQAAVSQPLLQCLNLTLNDLLSVQIVANSANDKQVVLRLRLAPMLTDRGGELRYIPDVVRLNLL